MDNRTIARQLLEVAHLLERRRANLYRVKAYRRAAETILGLERPVEELVASAGRKALKDLPGIGIKLSVKIETLVRTGQIATLKEDDIRLDSSGTAKSSLGLGMNDLHANGVSIPGDDPFQSHPVRAAVCAF